MLQGMIIISRKEYVELLHDQAYSIAIRKAGVDKYQLDHEQYYIDYLRQLYNKKILTIEETGFTEKELNIGYDIKLVFNERKI